MTLSAFFSPDTSAVALRRAVEGATRAIDVYSPSIESWSGCAPRRASCVGCSAAYTRQNEEQVLFRALLNAAARGVRVRLLTNKFDGTRECEGTVSMLSYFSEVFEVKTYATTTFQHAKVIIIDDCVALSSVNWSKSSFIENREAGVLMCAAAAAAVDFAAADSVSSYMRTVFDYDWTLGETWTPPNALSASDLAIIRNASYLEPFPLPKHNITEPHFVPSYSRTLIPGDKVALSVGPDAASTALYHELGNAKSTLDIYTYQITDDVFAKFINELSRRVRVRVILSRAIFMDEDRYESIRVVDRLRETSDGRITFFSSPHFYRYAHLKIWVRDGASESAVVGVSTGNFSPSDIPPIHPYPPFHDPAWRSINRDFNVVISDVKFAKQFSELIAGDGAHFNVYTKPTKF